MPIITAKEREAIATLALQVGKAFAAHVEFPAIPPPTFLKPEANAPRAAQQLISGPPSDAAFESVYTVAGGSALWPLSVICLVSTSAVVGNRKVALEYRTGSGVRYVIAGAPVDITEGDAWTLCWWPQAGDVAWPVEDAILAPLPEQYLYPGTQLALRIFDAQAGDTIGGVLISARLDALPDGDPSSGS